MSPRRVGVDGGGRGSLDCPRCGASIAVEVGAGLLRHSTPVRIRIRCRCGWSGWVLAERRTAARKRVSVAAALATGPGGDVVEVRIVDMSRTGVRLEGAPETLAPGTEATVRFELCPARPQRFERRVLVRWVDGGAAGCEFVADGDGPAYDPVYDLALAQHPAEG